MSEQWEGAVTVRLAALAREIAAGAPRGWKQAVLRGYATGSGAAGHRGFWYAPRALGSYDPDAIDVFGGLRELHTLLDAGDHLTVELEVDARGRFQAVLSERLDRSEVERRGFRYVLDPESTPPPAGEPHPGPDASEAGDPEEAVALLGTFVRRLDEVLGSDASLELPPPLPAADREELLGELGVALPRDLQALYAAADGDGGRGLLHGYGWFGLEMLAELADPGARWWVRRGWRRYVDGSFVHEYGPPLTIRRVEDHPAWIPFATNTFGDYLAVDLAPGPRGRPGQVILVGRSHDGPAYVADSVTTLLRRQVSALTDPESFRRDDGGLWINAGDVEQYKRSYDETCVLSVTGMAAAPVRGMRPEIRELTISNAPWVDLGPVRHAPALWQVSAKNCPGADLSPLLEAPVEVLDLDLVTVDLAGLTGHPTLRKVVLHTEKPVDLTPLRSCFRLYSLDLSGAPLADLTVLRELTGLRHLKLRRPQWDSLRPAREALPPALAVAELAEEPLQERKLFWSFDKAYKSPRPTLDDAVTWAGRLAGDAADVRTFKGRFS
ncbi:SMI1/KNR4 family protein [Flindersiella endophytica]